MADQKLHLQLSGRPVASLLNKVLYTTLQSITGQLMHMQRKRYYCKSCHRTFMQHPEWLHPTLHITQLLYIDICLSLTKMQSLRAVAEENGVSESIVYSILDLISFDTVSKLPQTIAIDEFKGDSGVLPVIRAADLKKYFRQFPKSERNQGQNQRFAL